MATLSYLSDVIGPRLTGFAEHEALRPTSGRGTGWRRGAPLSNAHLEACKGPFGRGWTLKRFSAQVIEPQCIPVIAFPKAWSPGTEGTVVAPVVYFDAKSEADFARFKGKIKGAIVLSAPVREVAAHFESQGVRKTDSELLALADADEPTPRGMGRRGQNAGQPAGGPQAARNGQAPGPGRFQMDPARDGPDGAGLEEAQVHRR